MMLHLHNPMSQAHLEDLRDRLDGAFLASGWTPRDRARVERLVGVVQAFDRGTLSLGQVTEAFECERVPGFSFCRWMTEMIDEGVYLQEALERAA